ncbi:MAG: hypothetical protein Q9166_003627 [cf. Caloplaca sp. 2 TL-2023]
MQFNWRSPPGMRLCTAASSKNFDYVKKLSASQVFDGATEKPLEDASRLQGNKFVSTIRQPPKTLPTSVKAKFVFASDIKDNEVGKLIYEDFLPKAFAEGKFVTAPDPYVIGKGPGSL